MRSDDFRDDLNGLRAVAVILVLLFHFEVRGFRGGFVGVDVFFVISGFLMTQIIVSKLRNDAFHLSAFYFARARRIFPALAVLCCFLLVVGWYSVAPTQYRALGRHVLAATAFASNFTFWREAGYFDSASHEKWLLHTWSLAVEWQFYLLFPVLLAFAWRLSATNATLIGTVALLFATSLTISILVTPIRPDAAYYLTPTRIWQLALGGLAYFARMPVDTRRTTSRIISYTGIAIVILSAILLSPRNPWPGYHALIPTTGAAMIVVSANKASRLLGNWPMQFIGNASYSIYLWHWPVVVVLFYFDKLRNPAAILTAIAFSIVLGHISYRLIETPVRRLGSRATPRAEFISYGLTATLVALSALVVYARDGFPIRLGTAEQQYTRAAAAASDWIHPGPNCKQNRDYIRCTNPGRQSAALLVIGDSLAEQWYPRFGLEPLESHSSVFLTQGGCPPIRGIRGTTSATRKCARFADAAWREVRAMQPDTLVIASIWTTHFLQRSGETKNTFCIAEQSHCRPILNHAILTEAFTQFEADLTAAVQMGIKVRIIGPMPLVGSDTVRATLGRIAAANLPLRVD